MAGNTTRSDATQSLFVVVNDPTTGNVKRIAIPADLQVGLEGRPSELQLTGRLAVAATDYTTDAVNKGTLYASNNDTVIGVNLGVSPLSGRISLYLPPTPRDGQLHFVKDMTGTAENVPIDIFPASGTTIDGVSSKSLVDAFGSLALIWLDGQWHMLVAGLGASGGGGASTASSFITINPEATLTGNRQLSGSSNITITDHGAKNGVSLDLTAILGLGAGTFNNADVTVDAYGRITAISAGSAAAPTNASYLTAVTEAGLAGSRHMSGGLGTTVTDGGGGSTFSYNVDPRIVPFNTGAVFSGGVSFSGSVGFGGNSLFNAGLTGSLTQLPSGIAYIVGVGGITATTNSLGQVILSTSLGNVAVSTTTWTDAGNTIYTTSSVSIDSQGRTVSQIGPDVYHWVSGTVGQSGTGAKKTVFGGDTVFSGSIFGASITGSLTKTTSGNPYIIGAGGIAIFTNSVGQVQVSGAISQSWGQVNGGQYTTGTVSIDAGGKTVGQMGTDLVFWVSGTANFPPGRTGRKAVGFGGDVYVSGSLIASGGLSGSLQMTRDGNPYIIAGTGMQIQTNSLGQIIIAANATASFGPWNDVGNSTFTTCSVSIDTSGRAVSSLGTDVFFFVSGTIDGPTNAAHLTVFGGDVVSSGSITAKFTGSLTQLANAGGAFIAPGRGMFTSTSSTGQVTIGSLGVPTDTMAPVLLTSATGSQPAGRTLTAGLGISFTDNGPGGTFVVAAAPTGGASVDPGAGFVLTSLTASAPSGRVLSAGTGISITDNGPGQSLVVGGNLASGFVQANYASVTSSSEWNVGVAGFANMPGMTATIATTGSPVMIVVTANVLATSAGSQTSLTLTRNGVNLGDSIRGIVTVGPIADLSNQNGSFIWVDTPTAGTWTYTLQGTQQTGTARVGAFGTGPTALGLFEMKNANVVTSTTTGSWNISSTAYNAVPGLSASIFVKRGPVMCIANLIVGAPVANNWIAASIFRNASNVETLGNGDLAITAASQNNEYLPNLMMILDQSPTIGSTNTYSVEARNGNGSSMIGSSSIPQQLIVWELTDTNWKYAATPTTINLGSSYTDVIGGVPAQIVTRGRPVLTLASIDSNPTTASGRAAYSLFRNNSSVQTGSKGLMLVDGEGVVSNNRMASFGWIDPVGAGSYTYKVEGFNVSGSNDTAEVGETNLFVYELDAGLYTVIDPWTDTGTNGIYTTSSVSIDPNSRTASSYGSDILFFVSGTATNNLTGTKTVVAGDAIVSGSLKVSQGLTGSLQLLPSGAPYLYGIGGVTVTTMSNGQVVISGSSGGGGSGGGASTYSTYLTLIPAPELPNSRTIIASGNIVSIDTGPTGTFTLLVSGAWYDRGNLMSTTGSVSIDSSNRATSQIGSDVYVFVSGTTALQPGTSGRSIPVFGGDLFVSGTIVAAGFSGSIARLANGNASIVGIGGTNVSTGAAGQVIISSTISPQFWGDVANAAYTTSSVSIDGKGRIASQLGADVLFFVSGSANRDVGGTGRVVALFGGDIYTSGSLYVSGGLTGSLQKTRDGNPYMIGGGTVTVMTNSQGQIVVSGTATPIAFTNVGNISITTVDGINYTASSSLGADPNAPFVLWATDAELTNAAVAQGIGAVVTSKVGSNLQISASLVTVTASGGTSVTTGGGTTYTISSSAPVVQNIVGAGSVGVTHTGQTWFISSSIFANASSSYVVIGVDAENPNERKLAVAGGLALIDGGAGSTVTVSGTIAAQVSSSYVVMAQDGFGPNERNLVAGVGITITDNGPGNSVVIGAKAVESFQSISGTGGTKVTNDGLGNYLISSSIYAFASASYIVVTTDAENPNERTLTATGSITLVDNGPGTALVISSSLVTLSASGSIDISTGGGTTYNVSAAFYAQKEGNYLVAAPDAENPRERTLTAGPAITFVDGGPGGTFVVEVTSGAFGTGPNAWIDGGGQMKTSASVAIGGNFNPEYALQYGPDTFFYVSGTIGLTGSAAFKSVFGGDVLVSGAITSLGGLTGSVTKLPNGNPYLVNAGGVQITSNSVGQVLLSASVSSSWGQLNNQQYTTGAVSIDSQGRGVGSIGTDVFVFISGTVLLPQTGSNTARQVPVFGGDVFVSGTVIAAGGFTGSITKTYAGNPFITATGQIAILTNSLGQVQISGTVSSSWGKSNGGLYTTGTVSIDSRGRTADVIGSDVNFFVSGTVLQVPGSAIRQVPVFGGDVFVSGTVIANGGLTGSVTRTPAGNPFIITAGQISILTNSLGQIFLSGTVSQSWGQINGGQYTTGTVSIDSRGRTADVIGTDINLFVSGTVLQPPGSALRTVPVFGGDVFVSGTIIANGGLTGSVTRTPQGNPFIVTTGQIAILTNSAGQVVISGTVSSSWGKSSGGLYTTGTVSIDSRGRTADVIGSDVNFFVSGTVLQPQGSTSRFVPVFGGDVFVSGTVIANQGFTGSLTLLANGNPYLVNKGFIQITSNSVGQILLSSTLSQSWGQLNNQQYTTGAVSIDSQGRGVGTIGSDVYFFVSGTTFLPQGTAGRQVPVFGGDVWISGSALSKQGFTGSITQTIAGNPFIITAGQISILTNSLGQVFLSGTVSQSWGQINGGQYTTGTVSIDASGRSAGVIGTDINLFVSGTTFLPQGTAGRVVPVFGGDVWISGSALSKQGFTGSITQTIAGNPLFVNVGGVQVITNSLGQILLSASVSSSWGQLNNQQYTTGAVSIDGAGREVQQIGTDVFVWISGTVGLPYSDVTRKVAVVGGDLIVSGGISGSLTKLVDGSTAYIVGIGNISVSTSSRGQVVISTNATAGGGIALESQNVALPLTTYTTLNFSGSDVSATDVGGAGTAIIQVPSYVRYGTYGQRPAPGTQGRFFFASDTAVAQWIDDGTQWRPLILGSVLGYEPPLSGSFTAINQGSATLTQFSGSLKYTGVNDGSTPTIRNFVQSMTSSTGYAEICIALNPNGSTAGSTFTNGGLIAQESSTSKAFCVGLTIFHSSELIVVQTQVYTNNTTRSTVSTYTPAFENAPLFLRLRRDSTTIYAEWSRDRYDWAVIESHALTSIFTSAPDNWGISGLGFNIVPRYNVLHYHTGSL